MVSIFCGGFQVIKLKPIRHLIIYLTIFFNLQELFQHHYGLISHPEFFVFLFEIFVGYFLLIFGVGFWDASFGKSVNKSN